MPYSFNHACFSIRLLGKSFNCSIPDDMFIRDVFAMGPPDDSPDATLSVEASERPLRIEMAGACGIRALRVTGEDACNMNIFRSCIGFLAHCLTPALFVHGCGLYSILKKKGILILGSQGSGKSTIAGALPMINIIDDDQVLIHGRELVGIGWRAAHTVRRKIGQTVLYEKTERRRARLGLVLLLTREREGGWIERFPIGALLDDPGILWHHNLDALEMPGHYCEGKTLPPVPAYRVGTSGGQRETIDEVCRLIDAMPTPPGLR